jgi:low affinity Fe/Cu permease
MKKRWVLVSAIVAMIAVGVVTTGVILAQETDAGDSPMSSFTSRVARILNLDEAQVQDAIDQALREMKDESVRHKLDRLVEQERITQEQADEYFEWYQSRPDNFPGFGERKWEFGRDGHGHGFRGFRFFSGAPQTPAMEGVHSGDGASP